VKAFIAARYHEVIDVEDNCYLDIIDGFIKDTLVFSVGAELQ